MARFEPPGVFGAAVGHSNFRDKLETEGFFASLKVGFRHARAHTHTEGNGVRVVRQVVLAPCLGDPWLEHSSHWQEKWEQQDVLRSFKAVVIETG